MLHHKEQSNIRKRKMLDLKQWNSKSKSLSIFGNGKKSRALAIKKGSIIKDGVLTRHIDARSGRPSTCSKCMWKIIFIMQEFDVFTFETIIAPKSDSVNTVAKFQIRLNRNYCVIWMIKIYFENTLAFNGSSRRRSRFTWNHSGANIFFPKWCHVFQQKKNGKNKLMRRNDIFFNHFFGSFVNFYTIDKYYYYSTSSSSSFISNKKLYKPLVSISCRTYVHSHSR